MKITIVVLCGFLFTHCVSFAQWVRTSYPEEFYTQPAVCATDSSIFIGNYSTLYRSDDNGESWKNLSNTRPIDRRISAITGLNGDIIGSFWHWNVDSSGGIYRSTDYGNSWTKTQGTGNEYDAFTFFYEVGDHLFGGLPNEGLLLSTDKGESWFNNTNSLKGEIRSLYYDKNKLFAMSYSSGEGVYCSTDTGQSWDSNVGGMKNNILYSIAGVDSVLYLAASGFVYRSFDEGLTWNNISNSEVSDEVIDRLLAGNNFLIASSHSGVVFMSNDIGDTWRNITDNLPSEIIYSIFFKDDMLFVCNVSGVWCRPLSDLAIKEVYSPSELTIEAYPNPFTASTTISYSLPKRDNVTIEVFDILGRKIQTLANEVMDAGQHSVVFNGENLPLGMYTVKITSGASSQEMKVILSK